MDIRTVGVIGCGLMGSGIAQVSAAAGYRTIVREVNDAVLQTGLGRIRKFLADGVAKGKVTEAAQADTLAHLAGTTDAADLAGCDIVIEAIVEHLDAKRAIYQTVEGVVQSEDIEARWIGHGGAFGQRDLSRTAAALGVDGVLLDPTSGDPWYRKAIRTSMGAALRIPFARAEEVR